MTFRNFRVRTAALLALLAMALQALWPLLAQAKPGPRTMLVQLCTVDDTTHYVEIAIGGDAPAEKRTYGHTGHCVMCVSGAAVLPGRVLSIALEPLAAERPLANADAQFVSTSHRLAQSRAPPRSL